MMPSQTPVGALAFQIPHRASEWEELGFERSCLGLGCKLGGLKWAGQQEHKTEK